MKKIPRKPEKKLSYSKSGVNTLQEEKGMKGLLKWISRADSFRKGIGRPVLKSGYFANVLDMGNNMGLAISCDGVGTKLLVAEMMNKYDTIGIDCIAMNVNDIICVGSEPISMLDYLAVQKVDPKIFEEIGKGLYLGAKLSNINIPGGEVAQIKEMVKGYRDDSGIDIAGTCVGIVPLDKIIIGQNVEENDVIIGLRSSGIHSNGLTLARSVLINKMGFNLNKYFPELKRTLGEELLEPTHIYVPEIMEILKSGINVKALANITGDGLTNLARIDKKNISFIIDYLPEPHPIFKLIQKFGAISDEEMFQTFNMGIGFCITVSKNDVKKCLEILNKHKVESHIIGYTVKNKKKKVFIESLNLVGENNNFTKVIS
ncbi:MAG: phosphoribosylformylglycinamidine cyclo-ligase [bacterium]|nr:phosphoribosylformylglycinamidine cyclo-ligase [bacterium]